MGTRVKNFDSSGVAPGGRLFAADLNSIQDQYADLINYAQNVGAGVYAIGDTGLQLVKFATGEVRLTSKFRTDGTIIAFDNISARLGGDTNPRVTTDLALNGIQLGPGNAAVDTNLYRAAANALKTDDSFEAVGAIKQNGVQVLIPGAAAGGVLSGTLPNPGFAPNPNFTGNLNASGLITENGRQVFSNLYSNVNDASVGASTSEVILYIATIPANLLSVASIVRIRAGGSWTSTTSARTIAAILKWGATYMFDLRFLTVTPSPHGGDWVIDAEIRVSNTSLQRAACTGIASSNASPQPPNTGIFYGCYLTAPTEPVAGDIDIRVVGHTPNSADDVTAKYFTVEVCPA